MSGSLVADLGIGPEIWLFLSLLGCLTLYFKFSRVWSVRNLDLLLLFVLAPGLMSLVANRATEGQSLLPFVLLFLGSAFWLIRCFVDLALSRRPLLEPNLNAAGLACLSVGILGLLMAETVSLTVYEGVARNPADPGGNVGQTSATENNHIPTVSDARVKEVINIAPLPSTLKSNPPRVILSRVLASLAHLGLVMALIAVGTWHFDRAMTGLAMATCYLILPYTRIALVDTGQLVPATLLVTAVAFYNRPALAGALLGLSAGIMPACLGLLVLWLGFYRRHGGIRFAASGLTVLLICAGLGLAFPDLSQFARDLGARSLSDVGFWPGVDAPSTRSLWRGIDVSYRLPVLIGYLALVIVTTIWPMEKNLGELIALSAALLVASQFWYLAEGGTLVLLYLPLVILMMFRPNLSTKRAIREPAPSVR